MNIFNYLNKIILFIVFCIFIYTGYILISNAGQGFDITDESYYILAASYPYDIVSTITHEAYYTHLLYSLSRYDLSLFRIFGITLLIFIAVFFALSLYYYVRKKFNIRENLWYKLLFVMPIVLSSLSYYKSWLLTPSYNWLTLVSVILVFSFLLRIVTYKNINYNKYISLDYLLLSFSFSLSFMAKPTTAFVLVLLSILFIIYEFKNINLKKSLISVFLMTSIIVFLHILIFDGGFISYYDRLIESMERMALMGGGHTLDSRYIDMIELIQKFFFEEFYFHQINSFYIYAVLFVVVILYIVRNKINALYSYIILMFIVLIMYSYFMFDYGFDKNFRLMWIRSIELLFLNFILIITTSLFMNKKMEFLRQIVKILPLLLIIILGSFAYKFGSNNQIIYSMSESMIFVITSIIVLSFIFDQKLYIKIFTSISGLILSIVIYHSIINAYEHPYRLITSIENQRCNVDLLGGIKVDTITQQYILDLQKLSTIHNTGKKTLYLIDMTGGSPGASVILNAKFFGSPWLIGAYSGSNQFVTRILEPFKDSLQLKKAWILTTAKGARKLDLNILNKVGLDFPNSYKKIGTVKTAHRHEVQEVWKPKKF